MEFRPAAVEQAMHVLEYRDIEEIIRLVGDAGDPTISMSVPERKRMLLEGVARLIESDIWIWTTSAVHPERNDVMTTCLIDGGWASDAEQGRVYEGMTSPRLNSVLDYYLESARNCKPITVKRQELMAEDVWNNVQDVWLGTGMEYAIVSTYPLSPRVVSAVGFHRRIGRPDFTDRDRAIVHLVFHQVDWLHRHGTNEPANDKVLELSPRERQVLVLMLAGDSRKQIAQKLAISEFTVGDYTKRIHRHFGVNSRAELQGYFLAGGKC